VDNLGDRLIGDVERGSRLGRGLIGVADTSETLDLVALGRLVDALAIALFALLERCVHVDKVEATLLRDERLCLQNQDKSSNRHFLSYRADSVFYRYLDTGLFVRGDGSTNNGSTGLGELRGDPGHAVDVDVAVLL